MRRVLILRSLVVTVVVLILAALAPASGATGLSYAQLNPKLHQRAVLLPVGSSAAEGVSCPKRTTPISGGAFVTETSNPSGPDPALAQGSYLTSSYPTAHGWHAGALNQSGLTDLDLVVYVFCTRHAIHVVTVREDGPIELGDRGIDHACPGTSQALAGGGFWHNYGSVKPNDGGTGVLIASTAYNAAHEWYAAGEMNTGSSTAVFTLVMRCSDSLRTFSRTAASSATVSSGTAGGYTATCPGASHVMSGGAAWYVGNSFVIFSPTWLSSSSVTNNAVGWYAAGYNGSGVTLRFDWYAYCLDDV